MNTNGDAAGTSRHVVPGQSPLRAFVQCPGCREGQRMRRNDLPGEEVLANVHGVGAPAAGCGAPDTGAPVGITITTITAV
jgi:hypothetical protein